jgi:hypothetical protein
MISGDQPETGDQRLGLVLFNFDSGQSHHPAPDTT